MLVIFNDTATTENYTLSLHDALPICASGATIRSPIQQLQQLPRRPPAVADRVLLRGRQLGHRAAVVVVHGHEGGVVAEAPRSEEHTSELQSRQYLVCRLLLEKKKSLT